MVSVFDYQDYRDYLMSWVQRQPKGGRGVKSIMAQAVNCQLTYVSRVLNGKADFSLEQTESISRLLGHTEEEADYFILLVQHARSGSVTLKNHFKRKIAEALNRRLVLKDRFKVKMELTAEEQATYYSRWYYVAIHILLSIPEFQSKEAIARYLDIPVRTVSEMIDFLISTGLAIEENKRLRMGISRIHLGSDSTLLVKHHINWRLQGINSIERLGVESEDLHYTSVISVSRDDALKLRSLLVNTIEKFNATVKDSADEMPQCLTLDFFRF